MCSRSIPELDKMCNCNIMGMINLVVAKLSSHCEGQVQILDEGLFHFSCCHKPGDSKAMEKGKSIKLCANGVSWSWEDEENVRTLG